MAPHHHSPHSDPIAGLESELLPRITAGNRLPATNNVRLNYARARMRRELEAQHGRTAWRTRPWATLAPALAGAAALWAALAGLFATHPIAAAGVAAGLILGGGVAADITNVGPPILENVGLQQAADTPGADHRPPAGVDALELAGTGAPDLGNTDTTSNSGNPNGPPSNAPTDTHGATVSPIARSNGDPSLTATDGATHGDIVSCAASTQGQAASAAAHADNTGASDDGPNATTGVSQACDEPTTESTTSPNGSSESGKPDGPGTNRNPNANANATDRPDNRPSAP